MTKGLRAIATNGPRAVRRVANAVQRCCEKLTTFKMKGLSHRYGLRGSASTS